MINQNMINNVLLKYAGIGKSKYLANPGDILKELEGKKILVFDTETTGLYAHVHQITEIAAEVVQGPDFKTLDSFHRKMKLTDKTKARMQCELQVEKKPGDRFKNIKECLEMNGYNPDDPELYEEDKALLEFEEFCDKHNAIILGQNAEFDLQMVNTRLKKIKPGTSIKKQFVIDTKMFFATYILPAFIAMSKKGETSVDPILKQLEKKDKEGKTYYSTSLGPLLKAFNVDIKGWHGAVADVKSTIDAYKKIMEFIKEHQDLPSDPEFKQEQAKAFKTQYSYKQRGREERKKFYKKYTL